MESLGLVIKRLRKANNLNQDAVADHLHLSISTISAFELNKLIPSEENLKKLESLFIANELESKIKIYAA